MTIFVAMDGAITDTPAPGNGTGRTALRDIVSLVVAGSILSIPLSTQLNGIVAGLAWPVSTGAAVVIGLPLAFFMRRKGWRRFYHVIFAGAVLGLVPWGLSALPSLPDMLWPMAAGVGGATVAWLVLRLQTLPLRFLPPKAVPLAALGLALLVLGIGFAATRGAALLVYGPAPTPGSTETVAAFEVPLPSETDRSQFLALLRREAEAEAEGLHVDASSKEELEQAGLAIPEATSTIRAAVWRGEKDNRLEASVMDMSHVGFAWISFARGEDPLLAERFRDRAMQKIIQQWPGTLALPIMPTGAIPLRDDLEATPTGYRVKPSAAARYAVSPEGSSLSPAGISVR